MVDESRAVWQAVCLPANIQESVLSYNRVYRDTGSDCCLMINPELLQVKHEL
jgi:hypothetical protein